MDINMTTKDFEYFRTIADEKSISKAAKKLFIAQPSLSQYIKRIEDSVGVPLIIRSSTGISLTYAGERYYALASHVLKSMEDFSFEISDISELQAGKVNVGITRHLGTILIPLILPVFHHKCPNIEITINEATSSLQEEYLLKNQIDFTLMHLPIPKNQNPSIHYIDLGEDPFMAVLPPDSPLLSKAHGKNKDGYPYLDIKELKDEPFIMESKGQRIRQIADNILEKANILTPNILLETTSISTVIQCISAGIGVALLPKQYLSLMRPVVKPIVCAIPEEYSAVWHMCIATTQNAYLSKADNLFLSIAMEAIQKSLFENNADWTSGMNDV